MRVNNGGGGGRWGVGVVAGTAGSEDLQQLFGSIYARLFVTKRIVFQMFRFSFKLSTVKTSAYKQPYTEVFSHFGASTSESETAQY